MASLRVALSGPSNSTRVHARGVPQVRKSKRPRARAHGHTCARSSLGSLCLSKDFHLPSALVRIAVPSLRARETALRASSSSSSSSLHLRSFSRASSPKYIDVAADLKSPRPPAVTGTRPFPLVTNYKHWVR